MEKVLKGHDDHVITCLQFCGNRIVSGSDDNTLKVWSAITGKVWVYCFSISSVKIGFFVGTGDGGCFLNQKAFI